MFTFTNRKFHTVVVSVLMLALLVNAMPSAVVTHAQGTDTSKPAAKYSEKYSVRSQNDANAFSAAFVQKTDGLYEACYAGRVCVFAEFVHVPYDPNTGLTEAGSTITTIGVTGMQAYKGVKGRHDFFGSITTTLGSAGTFDVTFDDLKNWKNETVHSQRDFVVQVTCDNSTSNVDITCGIVQGLAS